MATPIAIRVLSSHLSEAATLGFRAFFRCQTDEDIESLRQPWGRKVTKDEAASLLHDISPTSVAALKALGFVACPATSDTPESFFIPALFIQSFEDDVPVKDADGNVLPVSDVRTRNVNGFRGVTPISLSCSYCNEEAVYIDWDGMGFDDGYHERE